MSSVEERIKQLNAIRETIQQHENRMNEFLQVLGWSKDKLPKLKEETVSEKNESTGSTSSEIAQKIEVNEPTKSSDFEAIVNLCSKIEEKRSAATGFVDLNKLKRDLKRRRVKYRTTKVAPLTYTEELRELINLQMDLIKENQEK